MSSAAIDDRSPEGEERLSRTEQQRRTRERLLAAAAEVFAEHGFGGASLDAIANRAGYTRGAVYSNFADKTELLLALFDQGAELFRSEQLPQLLALPDEERALAVARWLIEDDVAEQLLLLLELSRLRGTDAHAAEALAQVVTTVRTILDGALTADPSIDADGEATREALTQGVLIVLLGVRSLRLIHGDPSPEVVAGMLDAVLGTGTAR